MLPFEIQLQLKGPVRAIFLPSFFSFEQWHHLSLVKKTQNCEGE